ncbi:ferric-chelate reductase [Hypoxylon sp. FL1284]|nr:ferric-chelate reductase [Hypoxylon sp. FL1284]
MSAFYYTGTLFLINLIFLYTGPHLSFLANVLSVFLYTLRRLHASISGVALALAIFHYIVEAAEQGGFSFAILQAIMILCVQAVVFPVLLRVALYKLALRLYQRLAFLFLYALWCHIRFGNWFLAVYVYMAVGLFTFVYLLQLGLLLISVDDRAISVRVHLRQPVTVEAGQYINLWVLLWSCVQTHPFTVVSWSDTPQNSLDLFIKPRCGLTRDLLRLAAYSPTTIATGFDIVTHLLYIKKLMYHHRVRQTPVCRVHLPLLNEALAEDSLPFGSFRKRAAIFPGTLSLPDILEGEIAKRHLKSRTVLVIPRFA